MEKNKKRKVLLGLIVTFAFILCASLSMVTYAWFTDSKSYTGDLTFGEVKLNVTGGVASEKISFDVTRTQVSYTAGGKIMPGDTITINLKFSLTSTSEPAYYLVFLSDTAGVFTTASYFKEGTTVYYNSGNSVYNASTGATATTTNKVGTVTTTTVDLPIKAVIATTTGNDKQKAATTVTMQIVAIQQANLTPANALTELNKLKA